MRTSPTSRPGVAGVVIAAGAAFLSLAVEHYVLVGLDPPFTYVVGVLALLGPFSAWCLYYRAVWPLAVMWATAVAGGVAVIGAYTLDWMIEGSPRWTSGAGLLVIGLAAALGTALLAVARLYRVNRVLRSEIAFNRGMGADGEMGQRESGPGTIGSARA